MSTVMLYIWAVLAHWVFSFGGIAVLAFVLYEKYRKKETPGKVFWAIAVILLLIAFYQAWLDEHHNTEVVIQEKQAAIIDKNRLDAVNGEKDKELIDKQQQIDWLRSHQSIQITEPPHQGHTHVVVTDPQPLRDNPYWPLHVGQLFAFNLTYMNTGDYTASVIGEGQQTSWRDSELDAMQWFKSVPVKKWTSAKDAVPHSGASYYYTWQGPIIQQKDINSFVAHQKFLCSAYRLRWRDESGCYETQTCECLESESGSPGFNWHQVISNETKVSCTQK